MRREEFLERILDRREPWDLTIIGGGATGLGIAVDAASRGYGVVLLEQSDFGKGTSSRSTKLVHGGVRYLQQGNVALVMEALRERGLLRQNAPHLVRDLSFVVPNYQWWEAPFYGIGLKVYDLLAGRRGLGRSELLSRAEVLRHIATLQPERLRGGVLYHDGQFDDSRLLINLAQTAAEQGACVLNHARVIHLVHETGRIHGLEFRDEETGREHRLTAHGVINAAGPFCDEVRGLDNPLTPPMLALSQGTHIVLDQSFLPGRTALMVPRTPDGRVLFAIPWHGHVVVGTTDTPIPAVRLEPHPTEAEIAFILETAGRYLVRRPTHHDILSVFTGIRPLVKSRHRLSTASLSRDHTLRVSDSGLLTITGGKWTTYRQMAEEAVDRALAVAHLNPRPCHTRSLRIHGAEGEREPTDPLSVYGADASHLEQLMRDDPGLAQPLHKALPLCGAQVVWAARQEMARTLDDVLARRTRALFLNARAALDLAPAVAELLARELGRDATWADRQLREFRQIARGYQPPSPTD